MAPSRLRLQQEVAQFQLQCWAPTTRRAYKAHKRAYFQFCALYSFDPVPATSDQLSMYAAYLARRLKYSSIKQYLNIVRLLHLQCDLPNPLLDFNLKITLRGITRALGDTPSSEIPITPPMLHHLLTKLHLDSPGDAAIFAAALTMFFGLLRRANVIPPAAAPFDPDLHLRRCDVTFSTESVTLNIRWSKTNQFRQRQKLIPLPRIKGHVLCPAQALYHYFLLTPNAPQQGPAFVVPTGTGNFSPISPQCFVSRIKSCLSDICSPADLGGHSFRRGGASWLRNCGVDIDFIRELGDWASEAYTRYVIVDTCNITSTLSRAAQCLPS